MASILNPWFTGNVATQTPELEVGKFSANLPFLFSRKPLIEQYKIAKDAGFKAVETGFPFENTIEDIAKAKTDSGLEQILLNCYTGDVTKMEVGFAALPGKEYEFRESLEKTIDYAKALDVRKVHIMSGRVEDELTREHDLTYEKNLRYAVRALEDQNIMSLIEPINRYSVPHYYLDTYHKAMMFIRKINNSNLKLMVDIFHLQLIKGDITNTLKELRDYIGHVQIAQVPFRNEPDADGEINYRYVLNTIRECGYEDYIGLEYTPIGGGLTKESLRWMKKFGYTL